MVQPYLVDFFLVGSHSCVRLTSDLCKNLLCPGPVVCHLASQGNSKVLFSDGAKLAVFLFLLLCGW